MDKNLSIAVGYANDCISGKIPACVEVIQACERFLEDINDLVFQYIPTEVNAVIKFISTFNLTEDHFGRKFELEAWQTFMICNIYGIYDGSMKRKYKQAYIELGRKNGKSQIVSVLALYHLISDKDSQVIISANSKDQAKRVDFHKVKQFCSQIDPKEKYLRQLYNSIEFGNNSLIVTASDAKKLDGMQPSFVLVDEFHEAPDNQLYNVLKSGMGARHDSLFWVVTTAGFNTGSFCYSLRTYCKEILSKIKEDNKIFALIYTLDPTDNYEDESCWIKANPNLNVSLNVDWLRAEVNTAKNNPTEAVGIKVKNMNMWLAKNSIEDWIPEEFITKSMQPLNMDDPMFEGFDLFCGVDLATVSDLASVTYMMQLNEKFYFWNTCYICEDSMNTNANRERYREASSQGDIVITRGNVIDYDYILQDILKVNVHHPISYLLYDKWNATQFAIDATDAGLFLKPFSQTPGSLNKPLKEFQRQLMKGNIVIQKNSLVKWQFGNVILKINHMGNYSLDKSTRSKKIDSVASMINAMGGWLESPRNVNIF